MPDDDDDEARQVPVPEPQLRQLTDARTLRALAHPVRIKLVEELTLRGPMTATEVGELIGESPTTCSFHLRQLARYGFVEEAGGGRGRARPWRARHIGMTVPGPGKLDAAAGLAAETTARLFRDRWLARFQAWQETKGSYPREWRDAADESEFLFYLTAAELRQLNDELRRLLTPRVRERLTDPSKRPPGAVPVEMLLLSYPIELPGQDGPPRAREDS
ncbi:MAG TPA: helix-turn-helix domain-containing protein [Trebonia sp.]|nr:helix-turn-helix domain-containing protein [Trebonia sp.]